MVMPPVESQRNRHREMQPVPGRALESACFGDVDEIPKMSVLHRHSHTLQACPLLIKSYPPRLA